MPNEPIGHRVWAVAEGYIPTWSTGPEPEMLSHDTVCLLNTGTEPAQVHITVYYSDRDPAGPYRVTVDGRRTKHVRFNDLTDPDRVESVAANSVLNGVPVRVAPAGLQDH